MATRSARGLGVDGDVIMNQVLVGGPCSDDGRRRF